MNFYEILYLEFFFTKIGHTSVYGENQIKIVHEDQHLEFLTIICPINYGRLCFL